MNVEKRSHFIYQDESGVVGTTGYFVVGLLFVKERQPLYDAIKRIREKHGYWKEFHFKDIHYFSSKRSRVACDVLDLILREHIYFRALFVSNEKLELKYFDDEIANSNQLTEEQIRKAKARGMFRAYNYFTLAVVKVVKPYIGKKIRFREWIFK